MLKRLFSAQVRLNKDTPEEVTMQDISNASFKFGIIRTVLLTLLVIPALLLITAGITLLFTGNYPSIELMFIVTVGFLVIRLYLDSYYITQQELESRITSVTLMQAVAKAQTDDESKAIVELLKKYREKKEEEDE